MLLRNAVIAAGVVGIAVCLLSMRTSHAQELSMTDQDFLKEAAQAGHYEIEASHEALARSEDPQVRDYAQMMIQEHQRLDQELNELAAAKEVVLPTAPGVMQKGKITMLKGKEGVDFDQYYAKNLGVKAHEDVIELFTEQVENGDDAEIVGFAQDVLPILRQHLQHAQSLHSQMDAKQK